MSTAGRVVLLNRSGSRRVPRSTSFERWVRAALAGRRTRLDEVTVVLLDKKRARALNDEFRGKDYATNVLSFPYESMPGEKSRHLGDLALCPSVIEDEARRQGKTVRDHYAHLTVHGTLHLLGFDHGSDRDAERMEALECSILQKMGIADPYIDAG